MKPADIPKNEKDRLKALDSYAILDTAPEQEFDDITKIASQICNTPISTITLIDRNRQWYKSNRGMDSPEGARDISFCGHAINNPGEIFVVNDSRKDERFSDNPIVTAHPHVIFYAGVPLVNADGYSLGTLCVIDNKPRELSEKQLESLKALSNQVVQLFELRRTNKALTESREEVKRRNQELEQFAYVVSHDIKSPLNNILSLTEMLKNGNSDSNQKEIVDYLGTSALRLKKLVDDVIAYYASDNIISQQPTEIQIGLLIEPLIDLLDPTRSHAINYPKNKTIVANEGALKQIFINLLSNALKYNDKEKVEVNIDVSENDAEYFIKIQDNGVGIEPQQLHKIFDPFVTLGKKDRYNNPGTGIGLSIVKKLVEKLNGQIHVSSNPGLGTTFSFTIRK